MTVLLFHCFVFMHFSLKGYRCDIEIKNVGSAYRIACVHISAFPLPRMSMVSSRHSISAQQIHKCINVNILMSSFEASHI